MLDNYGKLRAAAVNALKVVIPGIEAAMASSIVKRSHLAIHIARRCPDGTYETLHEYVIGARKEWEHPYDLIAEGKTVITARTGLPSRIVQLLHPELLLPSDVRFWGNWIEGDLIASCSGVQPWYDEAFSKMLLSAMLAEAETVRIALDAVSADFDTYDGRVLAPTD